MNSLSRLPMECIEHILNGLPASRSPTPSSLPTPNEAIDPEFFFALCSPSISQPPTSTLPCFLAIVSTPAATPTTATTNHFTLHYFPQPPPPHPPPQPRNFHVLDLGYYPFIYRNPFSGLASAVTMWSNQRSIICALPSDISVGNMSRVAALEINIISNPEQLDPLPPPRPLNYLGHLHHLDFAIQSEPLPPPSSTSWNHRSPVRCTPLHLGDRSPWTTGDDGVRLDEILIDDSYGAKFDAEDETMLALINFVEEHARLFKGILKTTNCFRRLFLPSQYVKDGPLTFAPLEQVTLRYGNLFTKEVNDIAVAFYGTLQFIIVTATYLCQDIVPTLPDHLERITELKLEGWPALTFHPETLRSASKLRVLRICANALSPHTCFIPPVKELNRAYGIQEDNSLDEAGARTGNSQTTTALSEMMRHPIWSWDWRLPQLSTSTLTGGLPTGYSTTIATFDNNEPAGITSRRRRRAQRAFSWALISLIMSGHWIMDDTVLPLLLQESFSKLPEVSIRGGSGYSLKVVVH
ncbi:MAG: hypothetical protein J3R72DRAFT_529707 [Linnemannia gamsii]|nr:MAG: hypothetical protein J3R72DRAFT_529707 [Linnemannia gamsii]